MTSARFEIVRTDAEQPWHARLIVNARTILTSENYTRMVGAERAILSAARTLGYVEPLLTLNVADALTAMPVEKILTARDPSRPWLSVKYIDERSAS